ncbi:MAG: hypothetical protein IAF38_02735 [Bacteroidia bacterium]|nr:hypothetical protein [Bacteroidia bacterium]
MKDKTIIYYSVYKDLFLLITFSFMFIIGIYFLCNLPAYKPLVKLIAGIVLAQGSFAVLFILIRKHILKKPQIILSNEGIYTRVHGLIKWKDLESESVKESDVTFSETSKKIRYFLILKEITRHGKETNITETRTMAISSLNIDPEELGSLIRKYRKNYGNSVSG